MTEDGYYAGEFTDAELNCRADIADYRRAVQEFFSRTISLSVERSPSNRF